MPIQYTMICSAVKMKMKILVMKIDIFLICVKLFTGTLYNSQTKLFALKF